MTELPKNVVVLSDGTGNAAAKVWRTNVWRVFQSLELSGSRQMAMYDDGVGSSAFKPLALLGGAAGWGLKRNVLDLYKFLCRNYTPDYQIYAFGFSRGAFTIRVLLGLVAHQGLIPYESEADLHRRAIGAYRAYRKARFASVWRLEMPFRSARDAVLALFGRRYDASSNIKSPPVRFVGLWDTVAAYGLPIEEMTRGVSQWIWPLELPNRILGPAVQRACHALSLDDERTTFHPVLWTEAAEKRAPPDEHGRRWTKGERISQVWFAGSHANVGGGYPDDALAHVSLTWIMEEARACGLRFKTAPDADPDAVINARSSRDKDGRLYDSRHGVAGYYRYGPRKIHDLCHRPASSRRERDEVTIDVPKIHESVLDRAGNGAHAYAPIGLPASYEVVTTAGEIIAPEASRFENPQQAATRAAMQETVWNLVWWRRIVYFLTLGASSYLLLFPVVQRTVPAAEFSTPLRLVSETVRTLSVFLPGFAGWWLDAFASNPGRFVAGVTVLGTFIGIGVALGNRIDGNMLALWRTILKERGMPRGTLPANVVFRLRTHPAYKAVHRAVKLHVIPLLSAVILVYLGAALISHLAFDVADAAGAFCREGQGGAPASLEAGETRVVENFGASAMCWSTGLELLEGRRYRIAVRQMSAPDGARYAAQFGGQEISRAPSFGGRVAMFGFLPFRRVLSRPWFSPIARIGAVGSDEYPLEPEIRQTREAQEPGSHDVPPPEVVAEIKARRTGELFLYVNDAVNGVPGLSDYLYRNNPGQASVEVTRLGRR
jgi:uncharacterized protein (DUF2235 family)